MLLCPASLCFKQNKILAIVLLDYFMSELEAITGFSLL